MAGEIYGPKGQLIATKESLQGVRIERLEEEVKLYQELYWSSIDGMLESNLTPAQQKKFDRTFKERRKQYQKKRE